MRDMDVDALEEEYLRGHADGYSAGVQANLAELVRLRIFAVNVRDTLDAADSFGDEIESSDIRVLLRDIAQWVTERPL